jgi:hypothetical protein
VRGIGFLDLTAGQVRELAPLVKPLAARIDLSQCRRNKFKEAGDVE